MVVFKRQYLWIVVFLLTFTMSIVSSACNQTMLISGEAYFRPETEIFVSNLRLLKTTNEGYETYKSEYSKNATNMYVSLPKINSTVTYEVTVSNKTNFVYVISQITPSLANSNITYEIENYKIGGGIDRISDISFNITFKYKSGVTSVPSDYSQIAGLAYKFERPTASMLSYDNSKSKSKCTDAQCALDELYVLYYKKGTARILIYDNSKTHTTCTDVQCALDELYDIYEDR